VNTAQKGRRAEHEIKRRLEAQGYIVTRAAASKGLFDLVAASSTHVRFIQVKSAKRFSRVTGVERERLEGCKLPANCSKEIWYRIDGDKTPRVEIVE
jgi:Holliday junction resolvase